VRALNSLSGKERRLVRLAFWGSVLAVLMGWLVLVPMKMAGLLPPEASWLRILGEGLVLGAVVPSYLVAALLSRRPDLAYFIVGLVALGIALAAKAVSWALQSFQ